MHGIPDHEMSRVRPARSSHLVTLLATGLGMLLLATTAAARDDARAREILDHAKALDRSERHWSDRRQTLTFRIHGKGGENTRELRLYETHAVDDSHKILVRFTDPSDVRGVGILAFTAKHGGGQQWMYTPAWRRERLLSDSARDQRIAGSDLTHNDLDLMTELPGWDESDADAELRGEEAIDGEPCHIIDLTPKRKDVPYKRITIWLGKSDLVARRLELFREGAAPVKRITQADIRPGGRIPVARRVIAETIADRTSTEILISDPTVFDVGVPEQCFTVATMNDPVGDDAACGASRGSSEPEAKERAGEG